MKKSLLLIFFVICATFTALFLPFGSVHGAESKYVLINDDGVILYALDENYNFIPLFAIPKTYYAEYSGRSNSSYYIVKYMDLSVGAGGSDLFLVKEAVNVGDTASVTSPYPSVFVKNAMSGAVLRKTPDASSASSAVIAAANTSLTYYGTLEGDGDTVWHFVGYNGSFGYIETSELISPPQVPPHPNSVINNPSVGGDNESSALVTVLLSAGIVIPLLIIFLLMFRPWRHRRARKKDVYFRPSLSESKEYKQENEPDPTYGGSPGIRRLPYDKY
ncbi:MAG: hypothetical protein LBQ27_03335 [Clostridiales bacterium]|nr:hypothetical protein [Clostridiales bacterium]